MARETLFSILSRAPWWMSVLIAAAMFAGVRTFLPDIAAVAAALPFLGIGVYSALRQWRAPGAASVAGALDKVRAMQWENFSAVMAEAFRRDGYSVTPVAQGAVDLELRKDSRVFVVSCKRWKVAQTGVGPLRDLHEAKQAHEAQECIYVAAGEFTENARRFATDNSMRLLNDTALGELVARVERRKRRWLLW